jgi:hypothetical protein
MNDQDISISNAASSQHINNFKAVRAGKICVQSSFLWNYDMGRLHNYAYNWINYICYFIMAKCLIFRHLQTTLYLGVLTWPSMCYCCIILYTTTCFDQSDHHHVAHMNIYRRYRIVRQHGSILANKQCKYFVKLKHVSCRCPSIY